MDFWALKISLGTFVSYMQPIDGEQIFGLFSPIILCQYHLNI